jgi:hypothetical protein
MLGHKSGSPPHSEPSDWPAVAEDPGAGQAKPSRRGVALSRALASSTWCPRSGNRIEPIVR